MNFDLSNLVDSGKDHVIIPIGNGMNDTYHGRRELLCCRLRHKFPYLRYVTEGDGE